MHACFTGLATALIVQSVQTVFKLNQRRIGQLSQVCDADALEALSKLCTVVAERLKIFEACKVSDLPHLGVVLNDYAERNHFGGDELFPRRGDSRNGFPIQLEILGEKQWVMSQFSDRYGWSVLEYGVQF